MNNKVTCKYCKKQISRSEVYSLQDRVYFCDEICYNAYYQTECGQLDMFLDYVWRLYDVEYRTSELYMMLRKQAEHYHNKHGFKYTGMLMTAKWYVETLERHWYNQYGLGQILPDKYLQLKEYYEEQQTLTKRLGHKKRDETERTVQGSLGKLKGKILSLD